MIDLFECRPLSVKLTREACAKRSAAVRRGRRNGRMGEAVRLRCEACVACEVGAAHRRGEAPSTWPDGSPIVQVQIGAPGAVRVESEVVEAPPLVERAASKRRKRAAWVGRTRTPAQPVEITCADCGVPCERYPNALRCGSCSDRRKREKRAEANRRWRARNGAGCATRGRLSDEDRAEIARRVAAGETHRAVAEAFGIHAHHVHRVIHGRPSRARRAA